MTQQRDIERLLDQWFSDGPDQAPDRVVDIVTDRIERQSQRPAWRLHWRPFPVNAYAKIAVAAAAVLIVAVVGYNLLPGRSTGVGGPASFGKSRRRSVIPSASPPATVEHMAGLVPRAPRARDPGRRHAKRPWLFEPSCTFTVPADWVNSVDGGRFLRPVSATRPRMRPNMPVSGDTASAIYVTILPSTSSDEFGVCPWVEPSAGPSATASLAPPTPSQAVIETDRVAVTIGGLDGTLGRRPARSGLDWHAAQLEPEDPPTQRTTGTSRHRIFQLDTPAGGSLAIIDRVAVRGRLRSVPRRSDADHRELSSST